MKSDSSPEFAGPQTWWQRGILILLTPIVIPVTVLFVGVPLLVIVTVTIPISAITSRLEIRRERRHQESLAERNRCLSWIAATEKFETGSLMIQWRHKYPVRLWWTLVNILPLAPCEPPEFEKLDFLGLEPPHPFIEWCDREYAIENSGTAALCVPPYSATR